MSGADRVKTPKGRSPFRIAIAAAAVLLGLVVSLEWWLGAPLWRAPVVVVVSAALGLWLAKLMMRDVRKARGK